MSETPVLMPDWWLNAMYPQDKKRIEETFDVRLVDFTEWMEQSDD